MKTFFQLLLSILLLASPHLVAQQQIKETAKVLSQQMEIGYSKTTSIVFPYTIHSVDRGSQDILVQKAKGLDNILQIKAAKQDFTETNLTVVTADGKLYNFVVCYSESPEKLTYSFPDTKGSSQIRYTDFTDNDKQILYGAELAFYERKKVNYAVENSGITLAVTGIFIHNELLHYRITIRNDTHISYDIDQLRFFVRDQKKAKRTASQEVEIIPIESYKRFEKVPAKSNSQFVCVLPKFTIPDDKDLIVELIEQSGGRHLQLELSNRKTAKVFPIPAFSN